MLSLHTSPLEQPGSGDAGGMNVYVDQVSRRLAAAGTSVEVFTRATRSDQPGVERLSDRLIIRHLEAGPFQGLRKEDLPGQLCALGAGVLRAEAARPEGWFDVVHSHYWLSGQVGWLSTDRWDVPLVHSMHTMAKVKNRDLGAHDSPEPVARIVAEQQLVDVADVLVANTEAEAADLRTLYSANDDSIRVIHPGVDLELFTPGDRSRERQRWGLDPTAPVLLFVGRLQPLKAPDLLLAAAAGLDPSVQVVICGGASGNGDLMPEQLRAQAQSLGIADRTTFLDPVPVPELVSLMRAATAVVVPSHSESFGLVAAEAQACGTPVVAAAVGGLTTVVADGRSGMLVADHRVDSWQQALNRLCSAPSLQRTLEAGARSHAERFSWDMTAEALMRTYQDARAARSATDRRTA